MVLKWKRCKTVDCKGIVAVSNEKGVCNQCYKIEVASLTAPIPKTPRRKIRAKTLKKYNMSEVDYEQMFKTQHFSCAICKKGNNAIKKFCVDHCHKTGKVRGILCGACNKAIGLLKDSRESLKAAIDYLDRSESDQMNTNTHFYGAKKS